MNIPRIEDLLDKLGGATEMSALDMAAGYFATDLREEDREKTAFLTWSGSPLIGNYTNKLATIWNSMNFRPRQQTRQVNNNRTQNKYPDFQKNPE